MGERQQWWEVWCGVLQKPNLMVVALLGGFAAIMILSAMVVLYFVRPASVAEKEFRLKVTNCKSNTRRCEGALVGTARGVFMITDCKSAGGNNEVSVAAVNRFTKEVWGEKLSKNVVPYLAFRGEDLWIALREAYNERSGLPTEDVLPVAQQKTEKKPPETVVVKPPEKKERPQQKSRKQRK